MYGYVYLTENLINGKCYIGKHKYNKDDNYNKKYIGSGKLLLNAIKKYGRDNFICTHIFECDSKDELNDKEIYFISKCNAVESDLFYNVAKGGEGGGHHQSKESIEKIRNKQLGKTVSAETRLKQSKSHKGVKLEITDARLAYWSSMKGKHRCGGWHHTDDVKKKIGAASKATKGRKRKEKMSDNEKQRRSMITKNVRSTQSKEERSRISKLGWETRRKNKEVI